VSEPYWRVVVDDRARKDLRRLDPPTRKRILSAIARLAQGAELTGDVKRLQGSNEYRLRVGDWRVRFERRKNRQLVIVIVRVLPRGRAYDR
jgi:mRNA interferase RelE/StbE